jgi:hypothetical protein
MNQLIGNERLVFDGANSRIAARFIAPAAAWLRRALPDLGQALILIAVSLALMFIGICLRIAAAASSNLGLAEALGNGVRLLLQVFS